MTARKLREALDLLDAAIAESKRTDIDSVAATRMAAARLELARALYHLRVARSGRRSSSTTTKVKGMSTFNRLSISGDVPYELTEQSDGVSDDGAMGQQIIGSCDCDAIGSGMRQHLNVSGLGSLAVGGLGDLAVAGLPGYLFTRKNLSNPVMRRRLGAHIKAMTPKLRRRVMARLKLAAAQTARVGAIHNIYPTVAGGGWSGITVSGRRSGGCPYANVAGALTP